MPTFSVFAAAAWSAAERRQRTRPAAVTNVRLRNDIYCSPNTPVDQRLDVFGRRSAGRRSLRRGRRTRRFDLEVAADTDHDLAPALQDQTVAKTAFRHLDVILGIPPDHDRIVVREARMHVADDRAGTSLGPASLPSVPRYIVEPCISPSASGSCSDHCQRAVLLPARVLIERRQQHSPGNPRGSASETSRRAR